METNDLEFVSVLENKPKPPGMNCIHNKPMDIYVLERTSNR